MYEKIVKDEIRFSRKYFSPRAQVGLPRCTAAGAHRMARKTGSKK
jgi:hypothetical protein